MLLPLKERATAHHPHFRLLTANAAVCGVDAPERALIPTGPPAAGEQYRFHFELTKCIGCHCCEVACHEQNSLPAEIQWRRVGEIEGGAYPLTERLHLSMGCNHCIEPACLTGCPVDAYRKDALTGLVLHSADACIGCQYCIWNCPYGVPQFNPERGVVGKCDMCHGRLAQGQTPACAAACPEGAIRIETVPVDAWREVYQEQANAPGLPSAALTLSTTRVTLPPDMPVNMRRADGDRVDLEDPHTPLIVMTVLTQLAAGAFACLAFAPDRTGASVALLVLLGALGASTLHLGRPIHAYRALRMWRRSWLSREVLLFTLFAMAAQGFMAGLWLSLPGTAIAGYAAGLCGLAGVAASGRLYLTPGRPAWQTWRTVAEFLASAAWLGPLFASVFAPGFVGLAIAGAAMQLALGWSKHRWLRASSEFELQATAGLLAAPLGAAVKVRWGLLLVAVVLAVAGRPGAALPVALLGELLGRYLFFVSVVPRGIAGRFLAQEAASA